jgi:hypothetical protein
MMACDAQYSSYMKVINSCTVLTSSTVCLSAMQLRCTLQNEYAEGMSIEDCLQLAVKVLNKTMDSTAPAADKMELTTIQRINGKVLTPYNVYSLALLNI